MGSTLGLDKYKAIIFDMDGTLVDTLESQLEIWEKTCRSFDLFFDKGLIQRLSGMPSLKIAEGICLNSNVNVAPKVIAESAFNNWIKYNHSPKLIEETAKIFWQYYEKTPIAVGTGARRESAESILNKVGLIDHISALVTSSDVINGKPSGETFLKAASLMGVKPESCIVFEDTEVGVTAAKNAGMDCYYFHNRKFTLHQNNFAS